ncbi:hypothetical protein BCR33DRAFT_763456 [Rhizoclosmatium globosum]|uniref:Uncharacterized protein n=1 Tax=Rhizoclosmatium globosum TaxID=329046 RepID=A0A1Y2CPY8_9FUNG|nr:hypothetical protein BCR33DRAFT_763456 [Rhizoclosmatium globosum]|eukprot:ORY48986.1 hypothetical protein BCR33DRAFT_763456 [Rhizoclosmatium globosum]
MGCNFSLLKKHCKTTSIQIVPAVKTDDPVIVSESVAAEAAECGNLRRTGVTATPSPASSCSVDTPHQGQDFGSLDQPVSMAEPLPASTVAFSSKTLLSTENQCESPTQTISSSGSELDRAPVESARSGSEPVRFFQNSLIESPVSSGKSLEDSTIDAQKKAIGRDPEGIAEMERRLAALLRAVDLGRVAKELSIIREESEYSSSSVDVQQQVQQFQTQTSMPNDLTATDVVIVEPIQDVSARRDSVSTLIQGQTDEIADTKDSQDENMKKLLSPSRSFLTPVLASGITPSSSSSSLNSAMTRRTVKFDEASIGRSRMDSVKSIERPFGRTQTQMDA